MRSLRPLRLVPFLIGLAALSGCGLAQEGPTGPGPTPSKVSYTALGASDAIGAGSSSPCVPFSPCPNGTGYVQIVARRLREANADMSFLNLGIPGAVLSPEIMTIGNSVGRQIPANFMDGEMPFVARDSTIVTVFADANGVNALAAALRQMESGKRSAFAQTQVEKFGKDFATFVTGIGERAPAAKIIVLNLPNLARLPSNVRSSDEERYWLRELSTGFTAAINATRSSRLRVVDLMCYAPIYQPSMYSGDGFHPNDAGYQELANLVSAAIETTPITPPTSCSFMF